MPKDASSWCVLAIQVRGGAAAASFPLQEAGQIGTGKKTRLISRNRKPSLQEASPVGVADGILRLRAPDWNPLWFRTRKTR